ncbi:MAG: glycosyltransferase family 4 protein [Candidatus Aenigmatarchaeota archaeon]
MKVLILGSKEYPLGTNKGDDPSPSGGMELYVDQLVKPLSKYVDITLITRRFRKTKKYENDKIKVHRVSWINGFFLRNPSFNINSFIKALRLDFDVLITNGEVSNFLGLIAAKIKRKPIIMVSHGLAAEQEQYNIIIKKMFSIADKITYYNANSVVTHAPQKLPKGTEYNFILPGFDRSKLTKDLSLRKKYKTKGTVIVFTGRLMKTKGVEYLIRGLAEIKNPYTCFIVGDGPEKHDLEKLSKNLKTNVIFTGFRNDVNKFLSMADVFVIPSFTESLSYSTLEAAYMKVPIIATDLDILDKNAFIKIKKRDSKSILQAIEKTIKNKKMRDEIVKNAYVFTTRFNWNEAAKKYYKIITQLKEKK